MNEFCWPLSARPVVQIASKFPFSRERIKRLYRHSTIALHQHHYQGEILIGEKRYELKPGDITISPPDFVSKYHLTSDGYHWCIHFAPIEGEAEMFKLPLHLRFAGGGSRVAEMMRDISEVNYRTASGKREKAMISLLTGTKLQALLLWLALENRKIPQPRFRKSDQTLDAAKDQLDVNFVNQFRVSELGRSNGLSGPYFSKRFQQRFGISIKAYTFQRRLELAKHLLLSTNLPVKEVAFECGIPNANYFNKQFRRVSGVSPSGYRAKNQRK